MIQQTEAGTEIINFSWDIVQKNKRAAFITEICFKRKNQNILDHM